jgi:alcohol dehydrogenase (cytochrome c)
VVTGGKQAIFDTLDAASGIYASSIDIGLQNVVTSIDPKTGAKNIDRKLVPGDGETKFICPHAGGARSWLPTSYDPATKLIYIPLVESCMDVLPVAAGEKNSAGEPRPYLRRILHDEVERHGNGSGDLPVDR